MTLDLRAVEALLTRQRTRNGNNCDENVGALCDTGDALLVVLREMREAAEEVIDPKHHDPARDLLAGKVASGGRCGEGRMRIKEWCDTCHRLVRALCPLHGECFYCCGCKGRRQ